jgi:hypothetical protein
MIACRVRPRNLIDILRGMNVRLRHTLTIALLTTAAATAAVRAHAEVARVEIATRADVGSSGYEKIVGTIHFAVDPKDARNRVIADIDKAPVNGSGQVEFSADLYILRPKDAARSNGIAFVDVVNRGRKMILNGFNRGGTTDPSTDADLGDGFLMRRGYTLVWVGWQFDVARQNGAIGIQVPRATGIKSVVRAEFTPNERGAQTVTDLAAYAVLDPAAADTTLTVRDGPFGRPTTVARGEWTLQGNTVTMASGFEPGRTYELAYRAGNLPIAGLGLAAFRDTAAWVRHSPDAVARAQHTIAFGSSQSGRFLRTFLYHGLNTDERGRQVFDGVIAHISGAARLSLNERGATPNALSMWTATSFPFADSATRDPISGKVEGLLDNDRARRNQPKIFYTNSAVEYWGGGRSASLIHTSPDGQSDLALPDTTRVYFLTGSQHSPGRFPARVSNGQQPDNPVEYWWTMRALLVGMENWVKQGTPPPPSQYPRLADGTLVPVNRFAFPTIPGVRSPRSVAPAQHAGRPLPFLVPQVGEDGNEIAGIRTPEILVPMATYTGWNFRNAGIGGTDQLVSLVGAAVPFANTAAERTAKKDPRRSVEERYPSADAYMAQARAAADALVAAGYLLADDVPHVQKRAEQHWTSRHDH